MGDLQQIVLALQNVFTLGNLAIIFGGLILGMIVGCIPGLSVTLGIILLLPLTYSFSSPDTAIISLLAVYGRRYVRRLYQRHHTEHAWYELGYCHHL